MLSARNGNHGTAASWPPSLAATMCTRGVWQLKGLVIKYAEKAGSSAGVRCVHPPAPPAP